jgi:TRAP-type C4-dicarboxylate transport system permease small subunit
VTTTSQDEGLGGQFHVEDEAVDVSIYGWEDWITFVLFWIMAAVVFYQVYTRYVLSDSAGWTEEIARYFLVAVVFIGASMSVRKNNHIQVDYFYRLMPRAMGRVLSVAVDVLRCLFLGYCVWLTWLLLQRIGTQQMAVIDLPVGWVFGAMLFGFVLMFGRSLQVAWRHWKAGYSVLERPESALEGAPAQQEG